MSKVFTLLRFLLVGGSTAGIYFCLTFVLVEFAGLNITLASSIAYITAVCFNYLSHFHWTFASEAPHGEVFIRYLVMIVGGVILNGLVMYFGTTMMHIHYMLMQIISAFVLAAWSLSLSSLWVFRSN